MPYYYYNYDLLSLLLLFIPLLIGVWAQMKVSSAFQKYSRIDTTRGYTGAQIARYILDRNNLQHVNIEHIRGSMTDHYDPRTNVVRLSDTVYSSSSVASIGVAAHECGHAIQYAMDYTPIRIRAAIIPMTNIGSYLAVPLVLIGLVLGSYPLAMVGVVGFALIALFQLVTLPVEFDASKRAVEVLSGMYPEEEMRGVQKVLTAAAMTYVAALISAVSQLLRLLLVVNRGRRR